MRGADRYEHRHPPHVARQADGRFAAVRRRALVQPALELTIRGPIARSDLPGLYRRACAALEGAADRVLVCDVTGVPVDAVAVEALARLALGARRQGCQIALRGAASELRELLRLMGLDEVLGLSGRR